MVNEAPKVGDSIIVRGQEMTITKVLPMGTVEVVSRSGNYFRVSGLGF